MNPVFEEQLRPIGLVKRNRLFSLQSTNSLHDSDGYYSKTRISSLIPYTKVAISSTQLKREIYNMEPEKHASNVVVSVTQRSDKDSLDAQDITTKGTDFINVDFIQCIGYIHIPAIYHSLFRSVASLSEKGMVGSIDCIYH